MPKVKSKAKAKVSQKFDRTLDYSNLNLRENPELYKIGRGEEGVFAVQPYKDELLPLWRFATVEAATESSQAIFNKFEKYREARDFVGCDISRKYLQMGFTRSRRYANHKGGKKFEKIDRQKVELPRLEVKDQDVEKVEVAKIFKAMLEKVNSDFRYAELKQSHVNR